MRWVSSPAAVMSRLVHGAQILARESANRCHGYQVTVLPSCVPAQSSFHLCLACLLDALHGRHVQHHIIVAFEVIVTC